MSVSRCTPGARAFGIPFAIEEMTVEAPLPAAFLDAMALLRANSV